MKLDKALNAILAVASAMMAALAAKDAVKDAAGSKKQAETNEQ